MPPRRSARAAAVADEHATSALSPLPLPVVLYIFSLLPVDCRLRCSEVCRGWRAVLLERSLWMRLDLSATSGVVQRQQPAVLDSLLRCAAARAGGGLLSLRVDCSVLPLGTLLPVVAANAGALRELRVHVPYEAVGFFPVAVEAVLRDAPLLDVFVTDLQCDDIYLPAARRILRNEAPFGPLHVRHLRALIGYEDEAGIVAFAADVAAHASLQALSLLYAQLDTAAALDAVVDAALARRMHRVLFRHCDLSPASAPALARLLGGDALTTLECEGMHLLDAPVARVLVAALRANSTLLSLTLISARVFHDAAAAELLGALTGHASVQTISVRGNRVADADRAAVGAALGVLVAANAPTLTHLDVSLCELGDDGMRALLEALPRNTHLQKLDCSENVMSQPFLRDVLLPAVRANVSLRELATHEFGDGGAYAAEAERIMRSRAAA